MMWGPGWGSPMWAFWWIFPLLGLLVCLGMIVMMVRAMRGGGFMCMGQHAGRADDTADLRRELRELREEGSSVRGVDVEGGLSGDGVGCGAVDAGGRGMPPGAAWGRGGVAKSLVLGGSGATNPLPSTIKSLRSEIA